MAVVAPAATVTEEGTVAEERLLVRVTVLPPLGAAPLSVTVPVELVPPVTVVGLSANPVKVTATGLMVNGAVFVTEPRLAVIVAVVTDDTKVVEAVNEALVAPAEMNTDDGTVALELLDESETLAPPDGAAAVSDTVPVELVPPVTDEEDKLRAFSVAPVPPVMTDMPVTNVKWPCVAVMLSPTLVAT